MYDQLQLNDYADRLASGARVRQWPRSRPPRPPSPPRRALASALRSLADVLASEPDARRA